jgi:hypothetical protein
MPSITVVQVFSGHCLGIELHDGTHREVDLSTALTGDISERLRNPEKLDEAYLDPGLRRGYWSNGAVFALGYLRSLVF